MHQVVKKRENFFPFDRLKSGVKAKRGKAFPCTSEMECLTKHSLFELVKWIKLKKREVLGMMERRQIVRLWQQGGAAVLVTLVRAG